MLADEPVVCFVQLTAVDGRRALVTLPNDPDLVDILAQNGVDISVSEGEQQGSFVSLLGNLLFPLLAFGGLFFLFRRAGGSGSGGGMGGMGGGMGGPMDFGKKKAKFQEDPETGITFEDVAVRLAAVAQHSPKLTVSAFRPVRRPAGSDRASFCLLLHAWHPISTTYLANSKLEFLHYLCPVLVGKYSHFLLTTDFDPDEPVLLLREWREPSWSCRRWWTS